MKYANDWKLKFRRGSIAMPNCACGVLDVEIFFR